MRLFNLSLLAGALLPGALGVEAADALPPAPGVQYLFNANITVGLSVDVGPIPAGNVTVIPIIGGAVLGPKLSGVLFPVHSSKFEMSRQ
jgi:hypothetical protein